MDKMIRQYMCKINYNNNVQFNLYKNTEDLNFTLNFNLCEELKKFIDLYV